VFFKREDAEALRQAGRAAIAAAGGNQQPPRGPAPNPVPGLPVIRLVPPAPGQQVQQQQRCNIL
jgi:hypothetical protein